MDPYSPPSQLWDIPRPSQMYGPLTLNGNWLERRALSEDLEMFEREITPAKRAAARRAKAFSDSKRVFAETGHRDDGFLYIEDAIHFTCSGMVPPSSRTGTEEKPALVIDMSEQSQMSGMAYAYADNRNYPPQTQRVRYGQAIFLTSLMNWHGMEWKLTSGPECTYDVNLEHRKPTVWLHPFPTRNSLWKLQCINRELHPIMENEFVDSRQPIVLIHVLTGRCLTVHFKKRFKTPYGNEYLMVCDTDFGRGRPETNSARFKLRIISVPPWKDDTDTEQKFRRDLENQIGEISKTEPVQANRNLVGFNVDKEPTAQGSFPEGWYNHQLHCIDEKPSPKHFENVERL
ncbi:uncharacterized protein LOC129593564 isoform X2 [Paramacrobiotus metropolitanus]|uniref:uncharacterized protein LOC129593564 isoform X2 n=1 Tax=Paramacrobiotus metropolitanus TaxID=2943436 RepID=UPI0024458C09|nr:uncharacterized protein LOC129593564 isoform X2 [Paramacrobiotus metropolitanus]